MTIVGVITRKKTDEIIKLKQIVSINTNYLTSSNEIQQVNNLLGKFSTQSRTV